MSPQDPPKETQQEEESNHSHQVIGELVLIPITRAIGKSEVPALARTLSAVAAREIGGELIKCVVLKFERGAQIDLFALRKLAAPLRALKVARIRAAALDMPNELVAMVQEQGLDELLQPFYMPAPAAEARTAPPKGSVKLTARDFAPIGRGIAETLRTLCQADVKPQTPHVHTQARSYYDGVAGIATISLDGATGTVALCFPRQVYLKVLSAMFKRPMSEIDPKLLDGAAELLNTSLGQARTILRSQGRELAINIPKPVYPLENSGPIVPAPSVVLPFESPLGVIELEIGLDQASFLSP